MCCCEKPTKNGEFGYRWNTVRDIGIYPINPPSIEEGDTILFDEPGRCGGVDSHSHHYRLIRSKYGSLKLLVRHGDGDRTIPYLSNETALITALNTLDSNGRYWVFNALYHAQSNARHEAAGIEADKWKNAAAEKRIKTRKLPSRGYVKVWIESSVL